MEQLTISNDKQALTESGAVGVVMRLASGTGVDDDGVKFRYFDYKTGFFQPATRVEWDAEGMEAVLPADVAGFLIGKGYARAMTGSEVRAYNRALGSDDTKTKEPDPPPAKEPDPPPPPVQETTTPVKEEAPSPEKETKQTSKPKKGDSK